MSSASKKSDTYRKNWGYSFHWTDKHLPREEINSLRAHYDKLGSNALEKLQVIAAGTKTEHVKYGHLSSKPDMYAVLRDHHDEDEALKEFWDELHYVPEWVDWKQIERAQKFFARYAVANSTAFALQGFIRENSVSLPQKTLNEYAILIDVGFSKYCGGFRSHWWLCHEELAVCIGRTCLVMVIP
jgi:hypothetical protein